MAMQEYHCRGCGQVFQVVEMPDEPAPEPVQCPACKSANLEHLATVAGEGALRSELPP